MMKTTLLTLAFCFFILFNSCRKDHASLKNEDSYASTSDFLEKNAPVFHNYVIDGMTGGQFTTQQGTVVEIPPQAFRDQMGHDITSTVNVQFKDIYKKSDMFFSDVPTTIYPSGQLLKSGGEFCIQVTAGNLPLMLKSGKTILVNQPGDLTGGIDSINNLTAFGRYDSSAINSGWYPNQYDTVYTSLTNYIYHLSWLNPNASPGTWINTDNATFFSAYPQTSLTLHPSNQESENCNVYLIFNDIATMIHVYSNGTNFTYSFAPQGLACTMVAIMIKNGSPYSAFVPITITANQVVNFTVSETTTAAFKNYLESLD